MADDEEGHADIRVGFRFKGDGGTCSYVGKDAETGVIDQKQPTMNFGDLNDKSRDEDIGRFVMHEFGHAIGCVHEHQANPIKWDEARVIADCQNFYKWSENTTRQ
ncbi:hypothetical protein LZ31DRAFT_598690 [Colletotrichum somersetense]|nr:hypothetical protein LZ31DRAFT_598690 [Colletotrichum somersetense]